MEAAPWPSELEAFAIDGSRVHGYDVEEDLAKHHRFTDVVYLALTGELPDEARSRAFEIVLVWAAPVSAREAGVHAAILAAMCGARPAGIVSTAGAVFAEGAVRAYEGWRAAGERGAVPPELRANTPEEARSVERLAAMLRGLVDAPLLEERPCRDVALVAALAACGVTSPIAVAGALAIARVPAAVAEAAPRTPADFSRYPTNTPPFEYEEP
jgi:hypothetical protein